MKKETYLQQGELQCYVYYHRNRVQRRVYYEIKRGEERLDFGMLELDEFLNELETGALFAAFAKEDFTEFANYIRERITTYWEVNQDGRNYYVEIHKELGQIDIWEDVNKAAVTEAGTRLSYQEFLSHKAIQEIILENMGASVLADVLKKVRERIKLYK